ncbi:MAG: FecR domain-containing protein [Pseudomonadota bacterium]
MPDHQKSRVAEEAADLFLRVASDPENPRLSAERDAFCARGEIEQKAYDAVRKAWTGVEPVEPRRRAPMILLAIALGCAVYLGYEPTRTFMLADHMSQHSPETLVLRSGDRIDMDASTALRDDSDARERRFTVIEGAALFDVASEARPFSVEMGPVSVRVTGTIFETAHQGEALVVSVIEGEVEVGLEGQTWLLSEGQGFTWSDATGARVGPRSPDSIAAWQQDRFVMNGTPLGDVVAVIDRRLPGPVVVLGDALASQTVSGILDLSDPMLALRTLAASRGLRVTSLGPMANVLSR